MNQASAFEIPSSVRDFAEKSVEQTKDAYNRFMDATRQAQNMFVNSSAAMGAGTKEFHETALRYAEANVQSGFDVAQQLVKARDAKEIVDIQTAYARQQMETFTKQAQELTRLLAQAAQKAQPNV